MHIGNILQQRLREDGKTVVWLASELGCHRTNVYNLFSKYSIDTQLLQRLCVIMNFNFFELYCQDVEEKLQKKPPAL